MHPWRVRLMVHPKSPALLLKCCLTPPTRLFPSGAWLWCRSQPAHLPGLPDPVSCRRRGVDWAVARRKGGVARAVKLGVEDRLLAPRGTKMTRIRRPRTPRSRARLSRSTGARWTAPRGLAGARRPRGRPADRAAERGRQSRAPPIVSASWCTGSPLRFRPVFYH